MESSLSKFLQRLTTVLLFGAVFLIPCFFLPLTSEILEFNKYFLFYFCVFLGLLSWVGRGVLRKTFEFKRTPLDIPLIILWAVVLLTSLVSQDRYSSFFGDFSLMSFNFLNITAFLIFYFLLVQQIDSSRRLLNFIFVFLVSGLMGVVYFIIKATKLFSIPFANWPQFSPVSVSNSLGGIFLICLLVISLSILAIRKRRLGIDILALLVFLSSLAGIVMIGFKMVWIILAIALIFVIVFLVSHTEEIRTSWTSVIFALFIAGILFIFLGTPQFLTAKLPVEVSLGNATSWGILKSTLTHSASNFLFGSGPSTFFYDFSQFRPASLNNTFAWNIRFRQPYSTAMEWGMTMGILGILSFLLMVLMELGLVINTWLRQIVIDKKKKIILPSASLEESPLIFWALTAVWLTLLVSFFLVNFGAAHWVLFWFFLGLMMRASVRLAKSELPETVISLKTTPQYTLVMSFSFILIFTAILVLGIYLGRFFFAETVYAKALKMNTAGDEGFKRLTALQKAIQYNPNRVPFYLTAAEAYLLKAQETANQGKDANQVAQLVSAAVGSARTASDKSPLNVATWEYLATMYANARAIAPEVNNWIISSLEKATELEPSNPTFYLGLGNAKLTERRYSEAKESFEKAISLKSDFLQGYISLALVNETENNLDKAIESLEKGVPYGRNDAIYVFQLGRYYFNRHKSNDWPLAELAFRRSLALNPNYSDALFALATLYDRTNNRPQALALYQRVLELNPGNKDVQARINKLNGSSAEPAVSPAPAEEKTAPSSKKNK